MQATQVKLKLWEDLKQASATPETVDSVQLWEELEAALGLLPLEQRLQTAGNSIEVKWKWKYLYRAVDSAGNTLDFLLSAKRDAAAKRFFRKALKARHTQTPRVITKVVP